MIFIICIVAVYLNPTMAASSKNLTAISWDHAVNSQALLTKALSSNVDMIEADIVIGTLINSTSIETLPIMGHPPANTSDISLHEFLQQILSYNQQHPYKKKGVKLDFKSIDTFNSSISMLSNLWNTMNYPVWLNADILPGPVNNTKTEPVNAQAFLAGCKRFPNSTLSIGWTTNWGSNFTTGQYLTTEVNDMISTLISNDIVGKGHPITFPVRAGIAAQSFNNLETLMVSLNKTNNITFTVWSSVGDTVDVKKLEDFILKFGVDKVYLDVPEELSSRMNLSNSGTSTPSKKIGMAIVCIIVLQLFVLLFK